MKTELNSLFKVLKISKIYLVFDRAFKYQVSDHETGMEILNGLLYVKQFEIIYAAF